MTTRIIAALAAVGALAGCSTTALQDDYGNSLDSLIKAQTANAATLSSPSTATVTGVDPDYAGKVVDEMRKGVSKHEDFKKRPIDMTLLGVEGGD
jgi:uncharacterized lipoprotein